MMFSNCMSLLQLGGHLLSLKTLKQEKCLMNKKKCVHV